MTWLGAVIQAIVLTVVGIVLMVGQLNWVSGDTPPWYRKTAIVVCVGAVATWILYGWLLAFSK